MQTRPEGSATGAVAARWGIGDALVGWVVAFVLANVTAAVLLSATGNLDAADDGPFWIVAVSQVAQWLGFGGAVWLLTRRGAGRGPRQELVVEGRWSDVPLGLGLGVFTQFVVLPILYVPILWLFGDHDVSESAQALTDQASGPAGVILLVAVVVIGAPIMEELFFRGIVLRACSQWLGPGWGLVASAVFFAAVHFQPLQFPALVVFGLLAGYLVQRTGRLVPSIITHIGFNAATIAALLLI